MYCITDQQIEYILNDIRRNGVEMEDLQLNLLDHICCIIEQSFKDDDDFESFYRQTIKQFYKKELKEIEVETINLLTFKNYYAMKKVMIITGVISAVAFIGGSVLKILHAPGASALLVLGMLMMSLLFLPIVVALKMKEISPIREKLVLVLGAFVGILYTFSTLFAINHWPGATAFWVATVAVSMFVFIPVYFFTGIRKPETKVNTILTSVLLVGATCLLFTMIALRPKLPKTAAYLYFKNEQLLKDMQRKHMATVPANAGENKLVADINNTCEQIKGLILQDAIGQSSLPADIENKNIPFEESNIEGSGFNENGLGYILLAELKTKVNAYNALKENENNKLPIDHSILNAKPDLIRFYNNLYTLNNITQLQMFLANAENGHLVSMK